MEYELRENCLDCDTYFELRESVGWNNFSREQAVKALGNSYYSILAEHDSGYIGMGRVVGDGLYLTLADIVVRPEYQGKGIGTAIIKRIIQYVENNMCEGSRVSLQLISEIGKEDFYIKQGFKLIPHDYCGPALRRILRK